MTDLGIRCLICGRLVDPDGAGTRQRVVGWQIQGRMRPSGAKGGSDIELREVLQEWAHPQCVALAKSGVSPYQEALV